VAVDTGDAPLVDAHCHLADAAFDADRAAVLARATAAGVRHIVVVADSAASTAQAVGLARSEALSATAGVHPHHASTWSPDVAAAIERALDDPEVVAVGETGLDYHYEFSPRTEQRRAFEAQLALAARRGLAVVVHSRDADNDMAAMLTTFGRDVRAVVLHSFSSGPDVFAAGMTIGAYFSFSGMVTFKRWDRTECVADCPADRLLVETDAPYLAPTPYRGKRNEPAFVAQVAARVAELRGEPLAQLAAQSSANAARCFGDRLIHCNPQYS
jgi:TatD DNase family protein